MPNLLNLMCASDGEISVPVSARHYFVLSGGCVWPERLCRLRCWFWTEGGWILIDDCRKFVAKGMLIALSGVRFILHTYFGSYNMLIGRHGISPQVRHFAVCSVCIGARGGARPVRARFSPWLSAPWDEAAVRGRLRHEVGRGTRSAAARGRPPGGRPARACCGARSAAEIRAWRPLQPVGYAYLFINFEVIFVGELC